MKTVTRPCPKCSAPMNLVVESDCDPEIIDAIASVTRCGKCRREQAHESLYNRMHKWNEERTKQEGRLPYKQD